MKKYSAEFNMNNHTVPSFITSEHGWEDNSWHNDVCPKFFNEKLNLCLWVGDNEKKHTENLYSVQLFDKLEEGNDIFATDSPNALLVFIEKYTHELVRAWMSATLPSQYHTYSLDEVPIDVFTEEELIRRNDLISLFY